jgi:hypothetical protein
MTACYARAANNTAAQDTLDAREILEQSGGRIVPEQPVSEIDPTNNSARYDCQPPPCDGCMLAAHCARTGFECYAFKAYVAGSRARILSPVLYKMTV